MQIDISIKIDGKDNKGMMGMSLDELMSEKPIIVRKKKKKKRKTALMKAVESAIPKKSAYTTETV